MSVRLDDLIQGLGAQVSGDLSCAIQDVCYDSRRVSPGALFAALPGENTDGHRFIPAALEAGAAALLVERKLDSPRVPCVRVPSVREVLGEIAARFFGRPGDSLQLIGITGTNGKTSTARMVEAILCTSGHPTGSLGTISARFDGREEPASLTPPESLDLQRTLNEMLQRGAECVALEVSSHSLALRRARPLRFEVAVFTQLTQDHLDYHGSLEAYGETKAALFGPDYLDGSAVLNAADAWLPRLEQNARRAGARLLRYSRHPASDAEIRASNEQPTLDGARFDVETPAGRAEIVLPIPGDFQLENALAAIGACLALGLELDAIAHGLAQCPAIPGRFERVADLEPAVFIDYAHTPDAVDRMLSRARPFVSGRLIFVFGCGGDRDRTKRVPMARAASRHADYVIATSDNPRTEDPEAILRDVASGLSGEFEIQVDRRQAIQLAIERADKEDVVVIAGKGHEDYQILGTQKHPFDDRVEARLALGIDT